MRFQNILLDFVHCVCYLIIIGTLIPISILSFLWKLIVFGIIKVFYNKTLCPTFGPLEYYFMRNDPNYLLRPNKTFQIVATLDGNNNLQDFKLNFTERILNVKKSNGSFTYERLRQYPKRFGGYFVFEQCQKFNVDNHIKLSSEVVNEVNLEDFIAKHSGYPFQEKTSPWEIILIPNYNNENKTLVFWRVHHVLSDGLSIFRLMMTRAFSGKNLEGDLAKLSQYKVSAPKLTPRSLYMKTIGWPRYFADKNFRNSKALCTGSKNQTSFVCSTNKIPLEYFKQLKKDQNRSMSLVLMAAVSLALQQFSQTQSKDKKCSDINVKTVVPLKRDEQDESLINHFGITGVKIPVNSTSATGTTIYSMMDYISKELEMFKETIGSPLEVLMYKLMDTLPFSIMNLISPKVGGVLISNVMGPSQDATFFGSPVEQIQFWIKSSKYLAISFNIISYNGFIRINVMGCSSFVQNEGNLKKLCESIETILMGLFTNSNWSLQDV